jgi:hypothetical protein
MSSVKKLKIKDPSFSNHNIHLRYELVIEEKSLLEILPTFIFGAKFEIELELEFELS